MPRVALDDHLLLEFCGNYALNRSKIVTRGFSGSLNTNITSPSAPEVPGAQGDPLLLEFCGNFARNRSEFVTRGFSGSLNTNIALPSAPEVPGAQGGSGCLFSWSFMVILLEIGRNSLLGDFRGR